MKVTTMSLMTAAVMMSAAVANAAPPPAGYPPAEPGFHWQQYPGGQWGKVQDGVTLGGCPDGKCNLRSVSSVPPMTLPATVTGHAAGAATTAGDDALAEVNAKRAAKGLRPYLRDEGLTVAARAAAAFRAARLMFGHTTGGRGDFQFLPPGVHAASAGCAAYPPSFGWMSCDVYDNYTYAGAAWVMGRDGKRYCHIFVR